jgi:hypothetical protein
MGETRWAREEKAIRAKEAEKIMGASFEIL